MSIALLLPVAGFAATYSQMVVFGDSLSDNGNLASVAPGVLAGLNYDPRRVTNGPTTTPSSSVVGLTVEQLNFSLGLAPLLPATIGGSNYAWAFATTATNGLDPANLITPGTGAQVGAYLSTHPVASPDVLYVIWAGANDLISGTTPAEIAAAEVNAIVNLRAQIGALLNSGAKNVLWFNLPDLGLTPRGFSEGAVLDAQLHTSSLQFRTDWANSIALLQAQFPTASITGVDTYSLFNSIYFNPGLYGITNLIEPARGVVGANPDKYLFWDDLHPTTNTHSILTGYALAQLAAASPVPDGDSSVDLVCALLGLTICSQWARRKRDRAEATAV